MKRRESPRKKKEDKEYEKELKKLVSENQIGNLSSSNSSSDDESPNVNFFGKSKPTNSNTKAPVQRRSRTLQITTTSLTHEAVKADSISKLKKIAEESKTQKSKEQKPKTDKLPSKQSNSKESNHKEVISQESNSKQMNSNQSSSKQMDFNQSSSSKTKMRKIEKQNDQSKYGEFLEPLFSDELPFRSLPEGFHLTTPIKQRTSQLNETSDSETLQSIFDIPTSEGNEPFSSYFEQATAEDRNVFVFAMHEEGPRLYLYCKYLVNSSQYGTICICILSPIFCVQFHPNSNCEDDHLEQEVEAIINKCDGRIVSKRWKEIMNYERSLKRVYEVDVSSTTDMTRLPIRGINYSKITGATYSLSDVFCLRKDIRGNAWISVHCSQAQHLMTTIPMYTAKTIDDISLIPNSKNEQCAFNICVFSLNLTEDQKIEIVTLRLFRQWDINHWNAFEGMKRGEEKVLTFAVTQDPNLLSNTKQSNIKYYSSENLLLETIMDVIEEADIDIIVSYDLISTDIPILLKRMKILNIPNWYLLGRHTRGSYAQNLTIKTITAGRVLCDLKNAYSSLFGIKSSNFSDLCSKELIDRPIVWIPDYDHLAKNPVLLRLIGLSQKDTKLLSQMVSKRSLLCVAKRISRLTGSQISSVLSSPEHTRFFESFLIFSLKKNNFFLPDRFPQPLDSNNISLFHFPSIIGVHDDVTYFEAPALIPFIIRQFSICLIKGKGQKILPSIVTQIIEKIQQLSQMLENPIEGCDISNNQNLQQKEEHKRKDIKSQIDAVTALLRSLTLFVSKPSYNFQLSEIVKNINEKIHTLFKDFDIIYKNEDSFLAKGNMISLLENFNSNQKIIRFNVKSIFSRVLIASNSSFIGMRDDGSTLSENFILDRYNWCQATRSMAKRLLEAALLNKNPLPVLQNFLDSQKERSDLVFTYQLPFFVVKHFFYPLSNFSTLQKPTNISFGDSLNINNNSNSNNSNNNDVLQNVHNSREFQKLQSEFVENNIQKMKKLIKEKIESGVITPVKTKIKYIVGENGEAINENSKLPIDNDFYKKHFVDEAVKILDPFPNYEKEIIYSSVGIINEESQKIEISCPFCNYKQEFESFICDNCGKEMSSIYFGNHLIAAIKSKIQSFINEKKKICDVYLCDFHCYSPQMCDIKHRDASKPYDYCSGHLRALQSPVDFSKMIKDLIEQIGNVKINDKNGKKVIEMANEYLFEFQRSNGLQSIKFSQLLSSESPIETLSTQESESFSFLSQL